MKHLPRYVFLSCVLVCVAACAALRRAGYTAGGAGAGAVAGAAVGGPVGAGVGAAAGAVAAQAVGESQELRDGDLVGEGAAVKYVTREVPVNHVPSLFWWALIGVFAWLKGHHILRAFKDRYPIAVIRTMLPSWAFSKKSEPS